MEETENVGTIRIRGARTHNLQNLTLDLPLGKLVGVTGISGSGKTSLALDTLFVEGQRRYLETLNPQIRRQLRRQSWADVDEIQGLPPTICLDSRTLSVGPRATLATLTEIHDLLRVVYFRAGVLHCPSCQSIVEQSTHDEILDDLVALPERTKLQLLAKVDDDPGISPQDRLRQIAQSGFVRARINGQLVDTSDVYVLAEDAPRPVIEAVVDRVIIKEGIRSRLAESLDVALRLGHGCCLVTIDGAPDRHYATIRFCGPCHRSFADPQLRTFSHFSAAGACPACLGLGVRLAEESPKPKRQEKSASKAQSQRAVAQVVSSEKCAECQGSRLGEVARHTFWEKRTLPDWLKLNVDEALKAMRQIETAWQQEAQPGRKTTQQGLLRQNLIPEIIRRLDGLQRLGLGYLTLDRSAQTLSGGELTRSRLATLIASQRKGYCFVLDEPSSGLHRADLYRVKNALNALRDVGNTVVVVEHEVDLLQGADWLVELGPGAGHLGGKLVTTGTPQATAEAPESVIGPWLKGCRQLIRATDSLDDQQHNKTSVNKVLPESIILGGCDAGFITIPPIRVRNVHVPALKLGIGQLVCFTGVSGSGKTTWLMEGILPALQQALNARHQRPGSKTLASGDRSLMATIPDELIEVVTIGQSPIGRGWKSFPMTVAGLWDLVRKIYAATKDAKLRGFTPTRFSPWHPEARCPVCLGQGEVTLEADFLPDWKTTCETCAGDRFNPATLAIRFRGKSLGDVLRMEFSEAAEFFANFERLARPLHLFCELGLGYLKLGQPMRTVSTGEAQRIRLASYLARPDFQGQRCFALDEPTTGLHPADVQALLKVFDRLVAAGHLLLVVEHHLDVIRAADQILDLGPGAGPQGGQLVAWGSQHDLRQNPASLTGQALRGDSIP